MYHDGVANPVAAALSGDSGGGVVAPDGRRILIQRDRDPPIEIDAATRRPLGRLDLGFDGYVIDWRPAGRRSTPT